MTNSIITGNGEYGIRTIPNDAGKMVNNDISGNTKEGIYILGGDILEDGIWEKNNSFYLINGGININSENFPKVEITPGVELKFNPNTGLTITKGSLYAYSTTEVITFTSNKNETDKTAGDWKGIYFGGDTEDSAAVLENCVIEYAGAITNSGLYFNSSSPKVVKSIVRKNNGHGIYCANASPQIENSTISDNTNYGIYCSDTSSRPNIIDNNISSNGNYPLRLGINGLGNLNNNLYTANGRQALEIIGERITNDLLIGNTGLKQYDVVSSPIYIYGDTVAAIQLTIDTGVILRFESGTGIQVGYGSNKGILRAIGGSQEPNKIKFTANTDTPFRGYWGNIYFDDGATDYDTASATGSILENCIIEYGAQPGYADENIYILNSSPGIKNNDIKESRTNGIRIDGASSPLIEGNTITNNGTYGIYLTSNIPRPFITENTITGNGSYPMRFWTNGINIITNTNIYSMNNPDMIEVIGEEIIDGEVRFKEAGIPYYINGNIVIGWRNDRNVRMEITEGVEMRMKKDCGIFVG
ncbi:MAG: right-handed parallel beta-helix repeat-containing protein, partial [bacterium]